MLRSNVHIEDSEECLACAYERRIAADEALRDELFPDARPLSEILNSAFTRAKSLFTGRGSPTHKE